MTNGDVIRTMTDEEIAKRFCEGDCPQERKSTVCAYMDENACEKCWLNWLKEEAET